MDFLCLTIDADMVIVLLSEHNEVCSTIIKMMVPYFQGLIPISFMNMEDN